MLPKSSIYYTLVLIFSACISPVLGQQNTPKLFFSSTDELDFKTVERPFTTQEKENFLPKFDSGYDTLHYNKQESKEEFLMGIHFLELNGDNSIDAIYYGYGGYEPNITIFFLQENGKFIEQSRHLESIASLEFDAKHQLQKVTFLNLGCCGDYMEFKTEYIVDAKFKFKPTKSSAKMSETTFPTQYLAQPIKFEVINDGYSLRYKPRIYDTPTEFRSSPLKGNILGTYESKAQGIAWAAYTDPSGRTWWFVEMQPTKKLKTEFMYDNHGAYISTPHTHLGWMSSRFLKILD